MELGFDQGTLDAGEARYELVISVDARRSGQYGDAEKPLMRERIYRVLETAFTQARVARDALHLEDRGDGVLISVPGRIAVARLLGLWIVEVHENLRQENRSLLVPLGLRVAMHVGPVRRDGRGISGHAVDLTCRLADSSVARRLLDRERADLVLAVSDSLYLEVVAAGGKFIDPARYAPARLTLKEGEVTAWFHLPGRPSPVIRETGPDEPATPPPVGPAPFVLADEDDHDGDHEDEDEDGEESVQYLARNNLYVHRDNVYEQSVHIGDNIGTDPRKA
ncbi:hypothetical protein [Streptomyces sp. NPDC007346]|uniref:hypothetical protein n=1 Tax=Streptomyces sp. NPDC007346 TaxID=3154682 RepID=UPI0034517773